MLNRRYTYTQDIVGDTFNMFYYDYVLFKNRSGSFLEFSFGHHLLKTTPSSSQCRGTGEDALSRWSIHHVNLIVGSPFKNGYKYG